LIKLSVMPSERYSMEGSFVALTSGSTATDSIGPPPVYQTTRPAPASATAKMAAAIHGSRRPTGRAAATAPPLCEIFASNSSSCCWLFRSSDSSFID
jgi:hypothetical protein